jgi:FkbM family methyltransferase
MRAELLYNPRALCERLSVASIRRRRLSRLRRTPAKDLTTGYIDSLELIDIAQSCGVKTIYDIGANVGSWTLLAKSLMPLAKVHAFEPLVTLRGSYLNNTRALTDVVFHNVALASENNTTRFHVTKFIDSSSILPPAPLAKKIFGTEEQEEIEVDARRLDDYRQENGLPFADLMKLDVQGYELKVLEGAKECLTRAKALITEVSFVPLYEGQCLFHDLVSFLAEQNLFVCAFGFGTMLGKRLVQTDVLFVKSDAQGKAG